VTSSSTGFMAILRGENSLPHALGAHGFGKFWIVAHFSS